MQFCWLTVTVLNIVESKRFKNGAFLFWGCMLINDRAAASVAGHSSTEWLKQREYEMNCDAMQFVVLLTSQPATHSVALLVCRPTYRARRATAVLRRCNRSESRRVPCNHAHGPGNSVHVHT